MNPAIWPRGILKRSLSLAALRAIASMTAVSAASVVVSVPAAAALWPAHTATAQGAAPPMAAAVAQTAQVTGQHRGYTNEKLFLRLDDGKEMTFVVAIPGDTERKWQKDFATLSRITVTYVPGAAGGLPVATALKNAAEGGKK